MNSTHRTAVKTVEKTFVEVFLIAAQCRLMCILEEHFVFDVTSYSKMGSFSDFFPCDTLLFSNEMKPQKIKF